MHRSLLDEDGSRELLARIIMEAIRDWPELDRRVFVAAHYDGQSPARVAETCGIACGEVRSILERCERRLHEALRGFRHPAHFNTGVTPVLSCILSSCAR